MFRTITKITALMIAIMSVTMVTKAQTTPAPNVYSDTITVTVTY